MLINVNEFTTTPEFNDAFDIPNALPEFKSRSKLLENGTVNHQTNALIYDSAKLVPQTIFKNT